VTERRKTQLVNRSEIRGPLHASANTHLYQREVERVVEAILNEIVNAISRGDRVELRGFGMFSAKIRPAWTGRNPRTSSIVPVRQKAVAFFRVGKEMHERLNREQPATPSIQG
jgi:integration host factor subunit beta